MMPRDRRRDHADCRPRIHVWKRPGGAEFAFHPTGRRHSMTSIGAAVEEALDQVERMPSVIIYEGEQG